MKQPERLSLQSADGAQLNLDALYQIAPSCFTEAADPKTGKIKRVVNFDVLRQLLGDDTVEGTTEAYEFNWVGKQEARAEVLRPIKKTLRPVKEDSVDWDNTQNLYIEGDNLEVLKLLQKSYLGKVKMIYIDPPYNTGKDFVYHDDSSRSQEEEDLAAGNIDELGNRYRKNTDSNGRFHSDWCSSFYTRLAVSRSLLRKDGVIFISIDEHELQNVLKIGEEVFGSCNYIGTLSVENNPKGRKNSSYISVSSEYCVIFAKEKDSAYFIENVPKKSSDMTLDENGRYVHNSGKRVLVGENSFNEVVTDPASDKNYSVYFKKDTYELSIVKELFGEVNTALLNKGFKKYYSYNDGKLVENTYTSSKFEQLFLEKALEFSNDKVYEKNFSDTIRIKSMLINREYEAIVNGNKQMFSMELTTTGAGTYLKELFNTTECPFSAPKNVGFLRMLISLFPITEEEFIVMDFYSGSSTTADAVMQLNVKDNGNRKFIMVQYPEDLDKNLEQADTLSKKSIKLAISICNKIGAPHTIPEIAKERIKRAGKKIKEEHSEAKDLDTGFRVFRVDESNFEDVERTPKDYNQDELDFYLNNIKKGRTDLDLLFGCMLDWGVKLSLPMTSEEVDGKMVYTVNEGDLVACFAEKVTDNVVKAMANKQPLRVIFRDSCFEQDADKINIYETFKQLLDWSDQDVVKNIRVI
ncbi:MAG: site-specific DNA-methyltransferase [Bacteroidales bacterium]|nr:site-specific DNA-methyltransferase [Bacteroidales bacterium]